MRSKLILVSVGIVAALGLTACQTSTPGVPNRTSAAPSLDTGSASAAGLSDQQVSEATQLYIVKCANCHKFYHPADYEETEWNRWMKKMGKKSKLKPDQYELLSRYLAAFRQQSGERKTPPRP